MAQAPFLIPDASVIGAWYLPGEVYDVQALGLLHDYETGRISFLAPSHLWYEVPSILSRAVGGGRIPAAQARMSLRHFRDLRIAQVHSQDLVDSGFEYSVQLQCSLYDAVYLALADYVEVPFVYADARLRRTLRGWHPRAVWLEDYDVHEPVPE